MKSTRTLGAWLIATTAIGPARGSGPADCVPASWDGLASLDALRGTPFNCLVVDAGAPAEEPRRRGLAMVRVATSGNAPDAVAPIPKEKLTRATTWQVLAVSDGSWPGIRVTDTATATPSTEPWIDSNTWIVRSIRAWSGSRPIWFTHSAPKDAGERDHLRALAEVAMAGGHWVVPVPAITRWSSLAAYARFFEEHPEWRRYEPSGALGIVQDSAAKETTMSGENLNLIARRGIPYRVIERPALSTSVIADLKVVVATDLAPATEAERKILRAFAQKGGELIEGEQDPEALSKDMIELVGYDNVGVRVYNAPSVMSYLTQAGDGRRILLHLINYATAPAMDIKVQVKGEFTSARLLRPDADPLALSMDRAGNKTVVSLPGLPVYAAVIWEK